LAGDGVGLWPSVGHNATFRRRKIMAEDWLIDVRKYAANADENVVQAIVRYCGIALQSRDGQLVAMSDKKERDTVRENYLKKKLGLTHTDAELDDAILSVGEVMKADRTKNRVTVYYLLAEKFGLLSAFGGVAGAAGAAAAGAAALAGSMGGADDDADAGVSAAPLAAAAGLGAAGLGAAAAAAAPSRAPDPEPAYATTSYDDGGDAGGGMGWLKWVLGAAVLLGLLFFLLRGCSNQEATTPVAGDTATEAKADDSTAKVEEPAKVDESAKTAEAAAATAPTGVGVEASDRDGKPMLTVYFDKAKTDLPGDFDKVAAVIKDYAVKNPGAKLAVSGFNSPTGSAAGNARLSKGRAENVGAALKKLGVPAGSVELVAPSQATQGVGEDAKARRVEVTVK
jgi:outer membrane protein OmpA-like peptidoglycan-associated protein